MTPLAGARAFFARQVPARLLEAPALFSVDRVIALGVDGEWWTLRLQSPAPHCMPGRAADAEVALSLDGPAFAQALGRPDALRQLFATGRVRVEGDLGAAMHLPDLLAVLGAARLPGGVATLFPQLGETGFVRERWPLQAHVEHGPLERLDAIADLPALASVQALLASWPGRLRLADRHGGRVVGTAEAGERYAHGHHLAFSDAERVFPVLRGWLARLRWELALPLPCFGRCPVYCSPPGVGEALHFDQNANLVLQLRGEKRWRLAPNSQVHLPTDRYTSALPVVSPELQLYGPAQLPVHMPHPAQEVLMRPGSVLYLPRGHWHETEAAADSLSLNFTFDQPVWADLAPPAWRTRLLPHARWRALATGAGGLHRGAAETARTHLQALLRSEPEALAREDAGAWLQRLRPVESGPDDLLCAPESTLA